MYSYHTGQGHLRKSEPVGTFGFFFIVKSPILISLIPVFYWLRSTDYNGDTQIDAGMGARSEQSPLELMLPAKH